MLRTATLAARLLLRPAVLWWVVLWVMFLCCTSSGQAQDGKTYWQVDGGGGAGTRAVMTLEGGTSGTVRLRFVKSRIEFEMSRIQDGTEYFSGQRLGNRISGFFTHNLLRGTNCAPAYRGELVLSQDDLSFTLAAAVIASAPVKREYDYRDGICGRVDMPTCRGWKPPAPVDSAPRDCNGLSAFRPADVTQGFQIHWPSKERVAPPVAPPVVASLPNAAAVPAPVAPVVQVTATLPAARVASDDTLIAVMLGALLVLGLLWRKFSAARFVGRVLARVFRWLLVLAALAAVLLAPMYWLGQHRELLTEGSAYHWAHFNISVPVATAMNRAAPYCGTLLLSSPAGANPAFQTFETVAAPPHWPRCAASLQALADGALTWNGWSVAAQTLSGWWSWVWGNSGGALPWLGWLFGAIWSWVSIPFVWVWGWIASAFGAVGDLLWWLATPFVQFFWLVVTVIKWLVWFIVQVVIWVAWLLWQLLVFLYWVLSNALWYLALALKWFALNLGNYVIAIVATVLAFLLAANADNGFGKWVNQFVPVRDWVRDYIGRHGAEAQEQEKRDNERREREQREEQERKAHPSGVSLGDFHNALDVFGLKNKTDPVISSEEAMRQLYRTLRVKAHPDNSGGSHAQFLAVDAAWVMICKRQSWKARK